MWLLLRPYLFQQEALELVWLFISSVQSLSRVQLIANPWTAVLQVSQSKTNFQSFLKLTCIESVMPCHHLILSCPLLLLPQSFPASGSFPVSQFFTSGGQSVGASASVLSMNGGGDGSVAESYLTLVIPWTGNLPGSPVHGILQARILEGKNEYIVLISFRIDRLDSPRSSQESSLTPQFKSIISSALSFLYGPTLTSIQDYWINHSLDQMDLCQPNNVSAF